MSYIRVVWSFPHYLARITNGVTTNMSTQDRGGAAWRHRVRIAEQGIPTWEWTNEDSGATSDDLWLRVAIGEHPLTVWREYRGLTTEALAARSGLSPHLIAALEDDEVFFADDLKDRIGLALNVDPHALTRLVDFDRKCA
jgi:hypothetical protein